MRALRIPHPALVKVAECGLRNQARLPFSASVIQSMILSPFLGFSDNSPHLILGYTTMVLGPSYEGEPE